MIPARRCASCTMCAISWPKWKVMSSPALQLPTLRPFQCTASGRCTRPPCQASPSSSGVTATGLNAVAGLLWKKPKPLASSAGIRLRRLTSLTSISEPDAVERLGRRRAHRDVAGDHRDLGLEVDAQVLARADDRRRAGRGSRRLPPWYISGSVQKKLGHLGAARLAHQLDVVDVRRAVGPLVGARQRRHAALRIESGMRGAPCPR